MDFIDLALAQRANPPPPEPPEREVDSLDDAPTATLNGRPLKVTMSSGVREPDKKVTPTVLNGEPTAVVPTNSDPAYPNNRQLTWREEVELRALTNAMLDTPDQQDAVIVYEGVKRVPGAIRRKLPEDPTKDFKDLLNGANKAMRNAAAGLGGSISSAAGSLGSSISSAVRSFIDTLWRLFESLKMPLYALVGGYLLLKLR